MKCLLLSFVLPAVTYAATNDEWAGRAIYQVVTDRYARSKDFDAPCTITNYCGGTWAGIAENLDYIQNMGFTAIQISPVNKNLESTTPYGQAFHGYWQTVSSEKSTRHGLRWGLRELF
jgi:alpha-amylase